MPIYLLPSSNLKDIKEVCMPIFRNHSFIFSNPFILVKVAVDQEPIPGNTNREAGTHPGWDSILLGCFGRG